MEAFNSPPLRKMTLRIPDSPVQALDIPGNKAIDPLDSLSISGMMTRIVNSPECATAAVPACARITLRIWSDSTSCTKKTSSSTLT